MDAPVPVDVADVAAQSAAPSTANDHEEPIMGCNFTTHDGNFTRPFTWMSCHDFQKNLVGEPSTRSMLAAANKLFPSWGAGCTQKATVVTSHGDSRCIIMMMITQQRQSSTQKNYNPSGLTRGPHSMYR